MSKVYLSLSLFNTSDNVSPAVNSTCGDEVDSQEGLRTIYPILYFIFITFNFCQTLMCNNHKQGFRIHPSVGIAIVIGLAQFIPWLNLCDMW